MVFCGFYFYISYNLTWIFSGFSREQLGQFGDSWGGFTSIFSALAFIGVVWSINSQNKSLEITVNQAKTQAEFLNVQSFENNLFQMLSLLQSMIQDMDIKSTKQSDTIASGRDVFQFLYNKTFRRHYNLKAGVDFFGYRRDWSRQIEEAYKQFYEERKQDVSHYLRFLYNIFKYIDNANVDESEKVRCAKIVRAQLSDYELLLLFYNGLHDNGRAFTPYIKKYQFWDNLPLGDLCSQRHILLYNKECYGMNPLYKKSVLLTQGYHFLIKK